MDSPDSADQTCAVNCDVKGESGFLINSDTHNITVRARSALETKRLKDKLKFFFSNPIEKWNTKRRLPYKFVIQVIKIFLVTFQVCVFAQSRYNHMHFSHTNQISFSHLFLKSWDSSREILSYPPMAGPLAVYQLDDFLDHVNFAVQNYAMVPNISVGQYMHIEGHSHPGKHIHLTMEYFDHNHGILQDDAKLIRGHFNIALPQAFNFSLNEFLKNHNTTVNYQSLQLLMLKFDLKSIVTKPMGSRCNRFSVVMRFENYDMDGQMRMSVSSSLQKLNCNPNSVFEKIYRNEYIWQNFLNFVVIIVCLVSFVLCARALVKAQMLKYRTMAYFREERKIELSFEGRLEFWNFWYIMILINDVLIIIGSYMEGNISRNEYTNNQWSICSLCLGTGDLLVWFGVLRYFGFFKTYNVVILTLKRAFPQVMRFLLCTLIICAGFIFCGWLVLGPFHIKFRTVSRTAENLFSLVNGDDMFATFTILDSNSHIMWWYSRIYLYGFISLFIYVVLNLFLSVILEAYETIKEYYTVGFPKSDLQQFISEPDPEVSDSDSEEELTIDPTDRLCCFLKSIFCW